MESPPAPAALFMPHHEFVAAYRDGAVIVNFDPKLAARFLSAQLLLPLFMMPVLGIGVALALVGWIWTGLIVIALAIIVSRMIKRSAPHFLLQQALDDGNVYRNLQRAGVIRIVTRVPS